MSDELDKVNAAATAGVSTSRELTVQVLDDAGELAAGVPTPDADDVHVRKEL